MNEQNAMVPEEAIRISKEIDEQLPLGHIQSRHSESLNEANPTAAEYLDWLARRPALEPRPEVPALPAEGLAVDDPVPTTNCTGT